MTMRDWDIVTLALPTYTPPPETPAVLPVMVKWVSEKAVVLTFVASKSIAPPKEFVAVFPVKVEVWMLIVVPVPWESAAIAPPMPGAMLELNVEPLMVRCPTVVGRK